MKETSYCYTDVYKRQITTMPKLYLAMVNKKLLLEGSYKTLNVHKVTSKLLMVIIITFKYFIR